MKRFIKFLHIKNTRPIRGMWLSALCIFAFALFPTFATAEKLCGDNIIYMGNQQFNDNEFIYDDMDTYRDLQNNMITNRVKSGSIFLTAHKTEKGKVYECDKQYCGVNQFLLMKPGHVHEGLEINKLTLYVCSITPLNDEWKEWYSLQYCSATDELIQQNLKGNATDEYDLFKSATSGRYCIKKKNSTSSSTSQSNTAPTKKQPEPIKVTSPDTTSVSSIDVLPGVGDKCTTADLNERNATAGIYINNGNGVSCMATDCRDNFYLVYQNGESQGWCVASTYCTNDGEHLNIIDGTKTDLQCVSDANNENNNTNVNAPGASNGAGTENTTETEIAETPVDTESTCDIPIQVTDKNNAPISGATVTYDEETYTTDDNGNAQIRGIPTHTEFKINISHTDYKSITYLGEEMDSCPNEPVKISLSAAGDADTPPQNNGDDNNDPDPTKPDVDLESQRQIDQARIDELQENADAMREREQSLANRMIGGASMGAMGIGGMQVASALAEQSADDAAELDMTAYLATFRCDYGAGQNIRGGETNITLPGANILLPLYNEYTTLAADLKSRKESLGMAPGIESETILDATLYDNESIGITDGAYTSLSRALSNPTGADAAEWAAQRAETAEQLKTGAIVAGVGAAVGIAGNILTNYVGDQPRERSAEINAKYDALRDELRAKLKPIERESETAAIQTAPEIEPGKENTPEVKPTPPQPSAAETACTQNGGTWANNTCDCGTGKTWNFDTNNCTENEKPTPSNPELITINNAALFKYGSYDVGTQNETLDAVITQLSNADFTNNPAKLVLVAHTDSDGIKYGGTLWNDGIKTNEQLGRKRADAVKEYIKSHWTNKPTNVTIWAWSAGDSCADKNATDEQKKQERKVVFYLFYNNQTDDMSNLETLQNNKCSTFNTAASSVPPPPPAGA